MPSFKTCLASFAVLAFAFAPVVVASPTSPAQGVEHLSRRLAGDAALVSPNVVRSRVESRKEAVSRVLAAKRRAAAKAKRAFAATASVEERSSSTLEERAVVAKKKAVTVPKKKTKGPTAAAIIAFSAYTTTRCAQAKTCANSANVDAFTGPNQLYSCNRVTRRCVVTCSPGFLGPDAGGQCTASAAVCPTPPANGIYTLSGNNCVLSCDSSLGFIAASVGGSLVCINPSTDPNNCGSAGNVCPVSYNGVGQPSCYQGTCSLRCGAGGTYRQFTPGGQAFCA